MPSNTDSSELASVGSTNPFQPPTVLDLLPLCTAGKECRVKATLNANYEAYLNSPERSGESTVLGSIDFDWYVEVRLLAFDGRPLPSGSIRFEPTN